MPEFSDHVVTTGKNDLKFLESLKPQTPETPESAENPATLGKAGFIFANSAGRQADGCRGPAGADAVRASTSRSVLEECKAAPGGANLHTNAGGLRRQRDSDGGGGPLRPGQRASCRCTAGVRAGCPCAAGVRAGC